MPDWQSVPREPTMEMFRAMLGSMTELVKIDDVAFRRFKRAWAAALDASPKKES